MKIVKVSAPLNVYRKSSKDEYQYYDDEVPLQTYLPPIDLITMRTSIDVEAHARRLEQPTREPAWEHGHRNV